jgi:hypothetical protein
MPLLDWKWAQFWFILCNWAGIVEPWPRKQESPQNLSSYELLALLRPSLPLHSVTTAPFPTATGRHRPLLLPPLRLLLLLPLGFSFPCSRRHLEAAAGAFPFLCSCFRCLDAAAGAFPFPCSPPSPT